jgi:hypothetical protein
MIKKSVTYKNFDDIEVTEILHFHFTEAEILELEASETGGLKAWGEALVESGNIVEIMEALKRIIGAAYGERSQDGRRFIKNEEIKDAFLHSDAYSTLLLELMQNSDQAGEFFASLVPKNSAASKLTPSEQARKNSEASLRGFQKAAEAQQPKFEPVAEPEVVELDPKSIVYATQGDQFKQAPTPDVIPATAPGEETDEQKRARLLAELAELG